MAPMTPPARRVSRPSTMIAGVALCAAASAPGSFSCSCSGSRRWRYSSLLSVKLRLILSAFWPCCTPAKQFHVPREQQRPRGPRRKALSDAKRRAYFAAWQWQRICAAMVANSLCAWPFRYSQHGFLGQLACLEGARLVEVVAAGSRCRRHTVTVPAGPRGCRRRRDEFLLAVVGPLDAHRTRPMRVISGVWRGRMPSSPDSPGRATNFASPEKMLSSAETTST